MPIIALTMPVVLPIAPLRQYLAKALPHWQWRCGDDDQGGPHDRATLERPQTIMGRGPAGMVMTTIQDRDVPLPLEAGAPPHRRHLQLSQPSTEDPELAKRLAVIVCASLMMEQDEAAHCQIAPGGRWYSAEDMRMGLAMCTADGAGQRPIDEFLLGYGTGGASAAPAGAAPASPLSPTMRSPAEMMAIDADLGLTFAKIVSEVAGEDMARRLGYAAPPDYAEERPRADRFPTFVVALRAPLRLDWNKAADIVAKIDPGGHWAAAPNGDDGAVFHGRGGAITIVQRPEPVARYCIEDALSRSFWFKGGLLAFDSQASQLVIRCDLDTRAADYDDVRETAVVASLLIGLVAAEPQAIAILNMGISTLVGAEEAAGMIGCLAAGELPVMLWTWTAPHSMAEQAISLSTGGMLPFLGYELEIWNAPGTAAYVADKLSKIIIYLLHKGPVVTDGNSFGETPGDRSIRGYFGESKAGRAHPTRALFLELDDAAAAVPRPDPVPAGHGKAGPPLAPPNTGFGRRAAGGFGRKGMN